VSLNDLRLKLDLRHRNSSFFEFEHRRVFGVQLYAMVSLPAIYPKGAPPYTFNLQTLGTDHRSGHSSGWNVATGLWHAPYELRGYAN